MASARVLVSIIACCAVTKAFDLRFVGISYNLLTGNPDGTHSGSSNTGGTDPGIKGTRRILKVSTEDGSAVILQRHSCRIQETIYENSKAYQEKLRNEINVAGSISYTTVSFAASAGFSGAQEETVNSHSLVHERNEVCFKGSARYKLELASSRSFTTTDSFASEICALPTHYHAHTKAAYMAYLNRWGTHVITEVQLGTKDIMRKKTSSSDVLEYAENNYSGSVSFEAAGATVSGSLSVDISVFKSTQDFKSLFTSSYSHYMIGTEALPEPIKLSLHDVTEFLTPTYWTNLNDLVSRQVCQSGFPLASIRTSMLQALADYPAYLHANPPQDSQVTVPLVWPEGSFGLPMVKPGCRGTIYPCPAGVWYQGSRFHDAEDKGNDNNVDPSDNHCLNIYQDHNIRWYFCMMHETSGAFRLKWPKGSYCLFKKGDCPNGFREGSVKWDDENSNNINSFIGYMPDGTFDGDSTFQFCCRNDRFTTTPIYLPTERPFFLIGNAGHCQKVHGMRERMVKVFWDCEDSSNSNQYTGSYPYRANYYPNDVLLEFCLYTKY